MLVNLTKKESDLLGVMTMLLFRDTPIAAPSTRLKSKYCSVMGVPP